MEELKKGLDYLPKVVPMIYILGFIIINGYLSNFGFSDFNILNATYLKVGVLFSILLSVIFLAIYLAHDKDNLTDDIRKSWPSLILSCNNILFVNIILSQSFFAILKAPNINNKLALLTWIFIFLYLGFRVFFSENRLAKNDRGFLVLNLPQLVLLIIINILLFCQNINSLFLFLFMSIISIQITISLGVYGDKNYRGRIISDFFVLIVASFFFGSKVYPKIPSRFGGGKEYRIVYNENVPNEISEKKKDTLIVLFENTDRFLLKDNKGKIKFNLKSEMKSYEIFQAKK
jgi:hypothetical protein